MEWLVNLYFLVAFFSTQVKCHLMVHNKSLLTGNSTELTEKFERLFTIVEKKIMDLPKNQEEYIMNLKKLLNETTNSLEFSPKYVPARDCIHLEKINLTKAYEKWLDDDAKMLKTIGLKLKRTKEVIQNDIQIIKMCQEVLESEGHGHSKVICIDDLKKKMEQIPLITSYGQDIHADEEYKIYISIKEEDFKIFTMTVKGRIWDCSCEHYPDKRRLCSP